MSNETESKCPVMHGSLSSNSSTGTSNKDWWPNQLNLSILHQHDQKGDPMDGDFDYAEEFKKLDYDSLKKDLNRNKYLDIINNNNVVSISVRQNRFSERKNNKYDEYSINKSKDFLVETVEYINQSIKFIKTKVDKPKFLLWSNDFTDLEKYFPQNEFLYVINFENKILNDLHLLTQCKYFIVGPSTFSWWGAWLSNKENKLCIRPKYINPSNNINFWPESWIAI